LVAITNFNNNIILQVYRPSEIISGALEFTLTELKRYDCIKVNFFGSAHFEWKSGETRYIGNEKYVDDSPAVEPPAEQHWLDRTWLI
jgi:hypothetical protein